MRVLQFVCAADPPLSQLQVLMTEQVNEWSRLRYLTDDPEYITQQFGPEQWHQHTTTPGLWWVNWTEIYANLGDSGRRIADVMIGTPQSPGPVCRTPLLGLVNLEVVEVSDLVASGYLPAQSEPV